MQVRLIHHCVLCTYSLFLTITVRTFVSRWTDTLKSTVMLNALCAILTNVRLAAVTH